MPHSDAANAPVYTPDDYQTGTVGADTITATAAFVYGHDGNDALTDWAGFNTIFGGAGNDRRRQCLWLQTQQRKIL